MLDAEMLLVGHVIHLTVAALNRYCLRIADAVDCGSWRRRRLSVGNAEPRTQPVDCSSNDLDLIITRSRRNSENKRPSDH